MDQVRLWFKRHLSDPQVVLLVLVIGTIGGLIYLMGDIIAPLLAAIVLAYLLQGIVARLERRGVPHMLAVVATFLFFLFLLVFVMIGLLPLLWRQLTQLIQQVPQMVNEAQRLLIQVRAEYPDFVTEQQLREFVGSISGQVVANTQTLVSPFLVTGLTLAVYLILVPFLVFFLLRDKDLIIGWGTGFLPRERQLTAQVWTEVNDQIGNYVRGKVWEMIIVGGVSFATFRLLGLDYALLLAALTGASVVIPYVGAMAVFVPVTVVAYFQWGLTAEFGFVVVAYTVIQALDGNVLAPLLFSEVVNLHPVAIIVSILFFGGMFGFWGVFFAIPLATVIQAVLRAWPRGGGAPPVPASEGSAAEEEAPVRDGAVAAPAALATEPQAKRSSAG